MHELVGADEHYEHASPVSPTPSVGVDPCVSPILRDRSGPPVCPTPSVGVDPYVSLAVPASCPVSLLAHQALASARSLTGQLRKLCHSMASCRLCPSKTACPLIVDFNAQLTIALQEVTDEWQLT